MGAHLPEALSSVALSCSLSWGRGWGHAESSARRHPELGLLVTRHPSVDVDGGRAAEAGQAHRGLFAPRSDGRVPTRLGVPREGRRPPSRGSGRAARQGRAAGGRSSLPGVELVSPWQPAGRCPDRAAGLPSGLKLCCTARRRLLTAHRAPWHFQCILRARAPSGWPSWVLRVVPSPASDRARTPPRTPVPVTPPLAKPGSCLLWSRHTLWWKVLEAGARRSPAVELGPGRWRPWPRAPSPAAPALTGSVTGLRWQLSVPVVTSVSARAVRKGLVFLF